VKQNCVFSTDYVEIELQKNSYDVISVTYLPLRHQNYVTIFFPIWVRPNQNFWLRQWIVLS